MTNYNISDFKLFFWYNEFLFYIYLLKEYSNIYTDNIKHYIWLLNLLLIKYLFYNKKFHNIKINNNIYLYQFTYWYSIYISKYVLFKKNNNISQKIILIKKTSKTRQKGRVKKFKVIIIVGNKTGWCGIGIGKDHFLQEAIIKSRINAFKNIIYFPFNYLNYINSNNYTLLNKKNQKIYIYSSKNILTQSKFNLLKVLFDYIGLVNINSKVIGSKNIIPIISFLKKSLN